jgi:U3 small nucleolar RNA-associated protein 20
LSVTRQTLISALCGIGKSSDLGPITEAVRELNAFSKSHIDEYDFDIMLPVLNKLGSAGSSQGSWLNLSVQDNDDRENPQTLFPLLYSCLHMLYSPDAVIGRAANKAIKALITTCSEQIHAQHQTTDLSHSKWMQFVEKTVIPCIRVGLTTKTDDNRRHFVLLIAHVARSFRNFQSSHLYGDLNSLIRDDDQDLDFFLNVTHLQIHRRVKGLQRLRKMITTVDKPIFSEQSLGNVLLPLALHPVYERSSKTEDALALEAIATVGAISGHLHWGKYHEALQSVLNSLTRHPENERHLIALLCAIIDSFHFTVEPETTESESENGSCKKIAGNGVSVIQAHL